MSKAVISNRIYLTRTKEIFDHCLKELTYKIPSNRPRIPPEIICDIHIVGDKVFSIPVGRVDLIPEGWEILDKRKLAPINLPTPQTTLRDDQVDVYDSVVDNCLVNAKPGWGKTFVGLNIAAKFNEKTLVVVHNTVLRDQWVEETKKVFGFTPGIIGTGKFQYETDIVISNTQTLGKHIQKYKDMFGLLIVDECHRVPATTFKNIVDACYARYKIGLSATIGRKDGKHVIIPDYFSKKVFAPKKDTAMKPIIYCIHSNIGLDNSLGHWARKVTALSEDEQYQNLICDIANIKINVDKHKILVVGDRLEFLESCANRVPNTTLVTSYTDGRLNIHKQIFNDLNGIFGTTSIYKEGVNIPPLSCLILGSPINNRYLLEQLIGRVTRPFKGKRTPEIIDIVLSDKVSKRQFAERMNYYASQNYKIIQVRND